MTDSTPSVVPPSAYLSLFKTQVSIFQNGAPGVFKILSADPRRVYVKVQTNPTANVSGYVLPGPIPNTFTTSTQSNLPQEFKFHDCPSIVQGEFYCGFQVLSQVYIIECLYVGG